MEYTKSYFLNLFTIAVCDTEIDASEIDLLYDIGIEKGFDKDQIDEILSQPHQINFVFPTSKRDQFEHLYDLARMALADRNIKEEELMLMKNLATRIGIEPENIDVIIESMFFSMQRGNNKDEIFSKLQKLI